MSHKFSVPIHNYCDRWCERCYMTSKCAIYEDTSGLSPEEMDERNKKFWENISEQMQQAIDLMREAALRHGVDLDKIISREHEYSLKRREKNRDHPASTLSKEYGMMVFNWFKNRDTIQEVGQQIVQNLKLGITDDRETYRRAANLKNCLEVIQWYELFIHVKIVRALSGKDDDYDGTDFQSDANGSAKIALIAIERSVKAWQKLHEFLPQEESQVITCIHMLKELQGYVESDFPQAWMFIRSGFDEG